MKTILVIASIIMLVWAFSCHAQTATIKLVWTAPGDDADVGTAYEYDVRYSTTGPITAATWESCTQVDNEPDPLVAGSQQSMIIAGLERGRTYWFALKTGDEPTNNPQNWSTISNICEIFIPDGSAPATVGDLSCTLIY